MPENVRDRDELLLNAIVTGDTSGIDPRDREETFIKAIAGKPVNYINNPGGLTINGTSFASLTSLIYESDTTITKTGDLDIRNFLDTLKYSDVVSFSAYIGDVSIAYGSVVRCYSTPAGYTLYVAGVGNIYRVGYSTTIHTLDITSILN